jgi:membrane protease YdiL (CAAX protease family)
MVAAFLGVQILVAVAIGVYAGYRHVVGGAPAPGGGIQIDSRVTLTAAVGGTLLAGLVVAWMLRRTADGNAAVGWRGASVRACARAALQGLGLVVVLTLLSSVLPAPSHRLGPLAGLAQAGGWARIAWAFLAVVVAPPVEEVVFRGVLYAGLAAKWRSEIAGAITTAVFVALHVTEIGTYWPAWLTIGLLGALALRARVATGSLLPAIALHATYNLGLVLAVYAATR